MYWYLSLHGDGVLIPNLPLCLEIKFWDSGELLLANFPPGLRHKYLLLYNNISYRKLSDGVMKACSTIRIKASILMDEKQLPYKYVVCSDDDVELNYEYLHGAPSAGPYVNRCLIVPVTVQSGGKNAWNI